MTPSIAALIALACAGTGASTVELAFDPNTGAWTGLRYERQLVLEAGQDVDIQWEGFQLPPVTEWRLVSHRRSGNTSVVVRRAGEWEIETTTDTHNSELHRRARFRWHGAGEVVVTGTALRTPVLRLSKAGHDRVLIPGNFPIIWHSVEALAEGSRLQESGWTRGEYGVSIVYGADVQLGIVAAYRFHHDQARVAVTRQRAGVVLEHSFDTVARLKPGEWLDVGEQILLVTRGTVNEIRNAVAGLSNRLGNGPPADTPADLGRTVLYEVHPWGRLESWGDGDRSHRYDRLTRLLPYYKSLGINTLWLLPVSWPPPWVYTLPEFDRVAPENGSPEQLKELVRSAHQLGLRVLIDLVTYGIHPDSDEVKRLPEDVWCRDRDGKPVRVWGGSVLAADTTHPAWQRRIEEAVKHWVTEYGFDGARLDCIGWGQALNWASRRPNAPLAYGGLQLNKIVRDAFRRHNVNACLLPEGGKPLVYRHADLIFDYPLYMALRDLTWHPDLQRWISDLQEWLEWERAAYPARGLKGLVRFLELHDTVSAVEYFGVGPSQALMAALVFMEGVPLLQQEQEIGFSEDLTRWLHLRQSERCFTHGTARYTAVRCSSGGVLTFLRESADGAAIVAVNLTGEILSCTLQWPAELSARFPRAYDAFRAQSLVSTRASARITIPAFRPAVILLKRTPWRPAPLTTRPSGPVWEVRTTEGTLRDRERDYATNLRPGETLEDALPTLRRARRAAEYGMLDGAVPPEVTQSPLRVRIDPWFVSMENQTMRLTLARRHGGVPARLEIRKGTGFAQVIGPGGDAYTDQGIFAPSLYASADGETNPRLSVERTSVGVRVVFRGILRQRSWNGVQTCAEATPRVVYALSYEMDESRTLRVGLTLESGVDRPAANYGFFALRVPVVGFREWSRGPLSGRAGEQTGVRLGHEGPSDTPFIVKSEAGVLSIRQGHGIQRLFLIEGNGECHLFIALIDGPFPGVMSNTPLHGELVLSAE